MSVFSLAISLTTQSGWPDALPQTLFISRIFSYCPFPGSSLSKTVVQYESTYSCAHIWTDSSMNNISLFLPPSVGLRDSLAVIDVSWEREAGETGVYDMAIWSTWVVLLTCICGLAHLWSWLHHFCLMMCCYWGCMTCGLINRTQL